uniref:Imizoquin biosynthesis cluster protein A n=1 Tax=Aspergillus flavus (strain ATCC 200026 / FGSC A1120 / IAM 13836 / NRRL 3357 / JCM 12722 / SRRC 167) TaxID=332952 RepID=IMQA_ASPFN|nr:RecName: Full=Imizoquin biosynthesis cluster protein A [Aspergillus flavus NRRL3357]
MVDSVFPAPSLVDETFLAPSSSETNDTAMAADGTLAKMNMFQFNSMLKEYSPPRFEDLFQDLDASKAGWEHYRPRLVSEVDLIDAEHYSLFSANTVSPL